MFDLLTHIGVLGGYSAAGVLAWRTIRQLGPSWYRRISLHTIGVASTGWAGFYGVLAADDLGWLVTEIETMVHLSRGLHTLTLGAFLVQLFAIQKATKGDNVKMRQDLDMLLRTIFEKDEDA